MTTVHFVVLLLLLLGVGIPPAQAAALRLPLQQRTKSLTAYLTHASQEALLTPASREAYFPKLDRSLKASLTRASQEDKHYASQKASLTPASQEAKPYLSQKASLTPASQEASLSKSHPDASLTLASQTDIPPEERNSDSDPRRVPLAVRSSDFFGWIQVGTPPQSFTVMLHCSPNNIWIPSALCPIDTYDVCKHHRRYDRHASFTYQPGGMNVGYLGMVAEGSVDTVTLGGLGVANQSFFEVFQYNYNDDHFPYDGLLGIKFEVSIFSNMMHQHLVDSSVFGVYFVKNSSSPADSGGLVVGGRDSSLYQGRLSYAGLTWKVEWQFTVDEVLLLNSPDMPSLCPGGAGCFGTPLISSHFIASCRWAIDTLHRYLGASVYADGHTYHFDCAELEGLPPVYFSVGNALLRVPWQSYVDKLVGPAGELVCLSSFVALDDAGSGGDDSDTRNGWLLGDAFFTSVYVEFDAENGRLGFAQSIYSH